MRTALDTNILSALWSGEPGAAKVLGFLSEASAAGGLVIGPIVHIECRGNPKLSEPELQQFLDDTRIVVDWAIDRPVWRLAGERFERYTRRRRQDRASEPKRFIADFLVGAHALIQADRLLTLDQRRYGIDFPELVLVEL